MNLIVKCYQFDYMVTKSIQIPW